MSDQRAKGYALAIGSAIGWGVSGTFAQFLFESRNVDPEWMVTIRLLLAGLILLMLAVFIKRQKAFVIWQNKKTAMSLVTFGCVGMLGVQYTYFAAIKNSNAATATVLQYLGPVFIAAHYAWIQKRVPRPIELFAITAAVAGTVLLVTHGDLSSLAISREALFWGLASALTLAFYSIQPAQLLRQFDSSLVVGWGMLVGGITLSFIHAPWNVTGVWDLSAFLSAAFIVIIGSLGAFYAYLTSVKIIGASKASLLACAEPLSAALVAVIWLNVSFGIYDWLGTALIIFTIVALTLAETKSTLPSTSSTPSK